LDRRPRNADAPIPRWWKEDRVQRMSWHVRDARRVTRSRRSVVCEVS
jgi:hypothetical protein